VVRAAGWGCGGSCSCHRHKDDGIAQAWGSWTLVRARTVCAEGQVARIPGDGIVICIVVLERVGRELVVQRRWRGGMHIAEGIGLAWGRRGGEAA
jgi:hypothetical protein